MTHDGAEERPYISPEDAQREADRAALERMYGSAKSDRKTQWGVGIALLVLGPVLIAVGAAMDGEVVMVTVGVLALGVGAWSFIDGLIRSKRADANGESPD
ncbi:MAG: hypothetical protein ACI8QC_003484 [Planctomycetota bacterium]|jgi:hypothetical protein